MSQADDVLGLPIEDAVDVVVQRDAPDPATDPPPEAVRSCLELVAEDGVVTEAAVEEAVAHVSKVVSTPETRVELATHALADARDSAEPVADLAAVRGRLEAFESELDALETELGALRDELGTVVHERDEIGDTYELARRIQGLTADANAVQGRADELQFDLEEFEAWLDDHDRRVDELEGDADALADALAELDDAIDALDDLGSGVDEPGPAWLDAALHHRVYALFHEDLAAERADLERWVDREGIDGDGRIDAVGRRLDDLAGALETARGRIEALAPADGAGDVDDRLSAFAAELDGIEPPVQWNAVQAILDEHRPDRGGVE